MGCLIQNALEDIMVTTQRFSIRSRSYDFCPPILHRGLHRIRLLLLLIFTFNSINVFADSQFADSQAETAASNVPRDAMEHFFHQSFNDLNEELEISADEGKKGVFIICH